jgi:hypothetical protein
MVKYIKLEDLLHSDDCVIVTKEMRRVLRHHWKRSGFSTRRLLQAHPPIPNGLTIAMVNGWISNRLHIAHSSHWDHVIKLWSALPDCDDYRMQRATRKKGPGRPRNVGSAMRIPLTRAMSDEFKAELARTNADMERDILNAPDAPEGVTQRLLDIWKYRHAITTRIDHWNFVMDRLRAMPDFKSIFVTSISTRK